MTMANHNNNNNNNDMATATRQELASLDVRRQALEQEAAAITAELTSPTGDNGQGAPMGVDTPLTDLDGYPRADIDLYRARSLRGRLAEIRTDHVQLMKQMEGLLQQLSTLTGETKQDDDANNSSENHERKPKPKFDPVSGKWVVKNSNGTIAGAGPEHNHRHFDSIDDSASTPLAAQLAQTTLGHSAAASTDASVTDNTNDAAPVAASIPTTPFARVDAVAPHSPAADAGLCEGDAIVQFGPNITHETADPFHEVAQLVPQAAGQQEAIALVVQRNVVAEASAAHNSAKEHVTLQLRPRPWDGRGLLGCHIVPV